MSREIKFRGYDKENNCWRYGFYTKLESGCRLYDAIIVKEEDGFTSYYIDDPETLGQYIGLKDKNGIDIYKGDKLKYDLKDGRFFESVVSWSEGSLGFVLRGQACYGLSLSNAYSHDIEIIGNIHEVKE